MNAFRMPQKIRSELSAGSKKRGNKKAVPKWGGFFMNFYDDLNYSTISPIRS